MAEKLDEKTTENIERKILGFLSEHPLPSVLLSFGVGVGLGMSNKASDLIRKIILQGGQRALEGSGGLSADTFSVNTLTGALFSAASTVIRKEIENTILSGGQARKTPARANA